MGQPEAFIHVKEGFFDERGGIANADTRRFPAELDGCLCSLGEEARAGHNLRSA
jgi:hypothetical protein